MSMITMILFPKQSKSMQYDVHDIQPKSKHGTEKCHLGVREKPVRQESCFLYHLNTLRIFTVAAKVSVSKRFRSMFQFGLQTLSLHGRKISRCLLTLATILDGVSGENKISDLNIIVFLTLRKVECSSKCQIISVSAFISLTLYHTTGPTCLLPHQ